jgi:hypothetical protein
MPTDLLSTLQHPAVRDLAWAIGSPGLLDSNNPDYQARVVEDGWCRDQLRAASGWLQALDHAPQPLLEFLAARPTRRLGHYFESLIIFWLTHTRDTSIIATNLQVQNPHQTVGEYDLLYRNAHHEVCHWELAVKFYLQSQPRPEPHYCIGPGTRDRLDLKLQTVFQRQLRLGQTPYGQAALPPGLRLDKVQAFIKGFLFYPALLPQPQAVQGISPDHLHGWWLRHGEAALPQRSSASCWCILPRLRWLSPARLEKDSGVMSRSELDSTLAQHFTSDGNAVLLAELQQVADDSWQEVARGFVVSREWPHLK